jgi:hypothetical protein
VGHTIISFDGVLMLYQLKILIMKQTSTQDLLILHGYGETTYDQKQLLSKAFAAEENLQEELMEIIRAKRQLNSKTMSPSETSIRIIMEHSYKSEHLQEI